MFFFNRRRPCCPQYDCCFRRCRMAWCFYFPPKPNFSYLNLPENFGYVSASEPYFYNGADGLYSPYFD